MRTRAVALERFEAIAGRHSQIFDLSGAIELNEFTQGYACDGTEASILLFGEELLSV